MITWIYRKRLMVLSLVVCHLSYGVAQTASSYYQPGVTAEGAIYFLPKTAIQITVQIEKSTYTPGDFCKYAERYLRIKGVSPTPSVSYRITAIRQEAIAVADTTKGFAVKFDAKTSATNVRLSDDGILLAINAEPKKLDAPQKYTPAPRSAAINPRQYMSEEILAAGSTAKMAELTAQDIYEIRESRNLLVRGQADNMPKDGEQLRLMLNQLDQQDRAMTSLFTGTTVNDTTEHTITIVPDKDINRQILFRFSQKLGLVDQDDLAGTPYYITIEDLKTVPAPEPVDPKKKGKQVPGVYVNIPGRLRSTVSNAKEALVTAEFPAGQFGNVELLSGALFNKRYTTRLWLHPLSGAVEKLEAEQPK
ncbi:MAG: DUF4831 family protein [Prevotella sp.]|nr:DUF4831 family protein [Prevotella sp.]